MTLSSKDYYDGEAENYHKHYDTDPMDMSMPYPANQFRRKLLEKVFSDRKNIIDVGCGDGSATKYIDAARCGFDISPEMIRRVNDPRFIVADIEDAESYKPLLQYGPFDGLACTGVLPHVRDEETVIRNIFRLVKGKAFVEFRNKLFGLFTFNRISAELIEEMSELPVDMSFLKMDEPKERPYDRQLAKFHNPLEIVETFRKVGFTKLRVHFYHYHPAPPFMEVEDPVRYREEAMKHEGVDSWKNWFMCSAFVVVADNG